MILLPAEIPAADPRRHCPLGVDDLTILVRRSTPVFFLLFFFAHLFLQVRFCVSVHLLPQRPMPMFVCCRKLLWLAALNERQLASYRAGKTNLSKFFMGQAFKATRGRVDGKIMEACLMKLLRGESESQAP